MTVFPCRGRICLLFILMAFLCPLPVLRAEPPEAARPDPLILEYEYGGARQQVCVVENGDFYLMSDTEHGRLKGSGHVGRIEDGRISVSMKVELEWRGGGGSGMEIDRRLRLGEFTGGAGSIPSGAMLEYLWIRRGLDPVPTLIDALRRRDTSSSFAVRYLKRLRGEAEPAIPALIEVATSERTLGAESKEIQGSAVWLRENAVSILGDMGPAAREGAPMLLKLMEEEHPIEIRVAAAIALWKIARHPDAAAAIVDALKHPERNVRFKVLSALGEMGAEAPFARAELPAMLEEEDLRVRAAAAWALWVTARDPRAVKTLIGILQRNESGRSEAAEALGRIGYPDAQLAVEALALEAFSNHAGHRHYVATALTRIDPSGEASLSLILDTLRRNEGRGCREASQVLAAAYGPTILPRLRELLDNDGPYARDLALSTLGAIGPASLDTLADALQHPDAKVRQRAATWLRDLGLTDAETAAAVPALVRVLDDEVEAVRVNASIALVEFGRTALPTVQQALDSESPHVRKSAASIIRQIQGVEALQAVGDENQ